MMAGREVTLTMPDAASLPKPLSRLPPRRGARYANVVQLVLLKLAQRFALMRAIQQAHEFI
jgi:hypothetical protein